MHANDSPTTPTMNTYKYTHYSTTDFNASEWEETGNLF